MFHGPNGQPKVKSRAEAMRVQYGEGIAKPSTGGGARLPPGGARLPPAGAMLVAGGRQLAPGGCKMVGEGECTVVVHYPSLGSWLLKLSFSNEPQTS